MARSLHGPSRSQSPMSPSPSFSDSESRLSPPSESQETLGPSTSRAGSPSEPRQQVPLPIEEVEEDSVTCLWEECGIVFTVLPTLIKHIHNGESLGIFQFLLCFSKHRDLGIVEWKSWWLSGDYTRRSFLGGSDRKGSSCPYQPWTDAGAWCWEKKYKGKNQYSWFLSDDFHGRLSFDI